MPRVAALVTAIHPAAGEPTTHVTAIKPVVGMRMGDSVVDKFTILSERVVALSSASTAARARCT